MDWDCRDRVLDADVRMGPLKNQKLNTHNATPEIISTLIHLATVILFAFLGSPVGMSPYLLKLQSVDWTYFIGQILIVGI